jgi:rubredoxin
LGEVKNEKNRNGTRYFVVREHARSEARFHEFKYECIMCGHVHNMEISHILPIRDWDETTPLGIINHPYNIVPMCKTCNFKFDPNDNVERKTFKSLYDELDRKIKLHRELHDSKKIGNVSYVYNIFQPTKYRIVVDKVNLFW